MSRVLLPLLHAGNGDLLSSRKQDRYHQGSVSRTAFLFFPEANSEPFCDKEPGPFPLYLIHSANEACQILWETKRIFSLLHELAKLTVLWEKALVLSWKDLRDV